MKKEVKKVGKKKPARANKKAKSLSLFTSKKKQNNNIKIAFYIVFIIVILFVLYFVNFKKPRKASTTNDNNVISEMFNPGSSKLITLPSTFRAYKQSDNEASGPASIMVLLSYYGSDGIFTEDIVKSMKSKHEAFHIGTCINQMKEILTTLKIKYWTDENYKAIPQLENENVGIGLIEKAIDEGYPVIVGWDKNPGQWSIVVGYDNKATEGVEDDIITMVNTDSEPNTDTYYKVQAHEFIDKWTFNNIFKEEPSAQELNDKCFIIVDKN